MTTTIIGNLRHMLPSRCFSQNENFENSYSHLMLLPFRNLIFNVYNGNQLNVFPFLFIVIECWMVWSFRFVRNRLLFLVSSRFSWCYFHSLHKFVYVADKLMWMWLVKRFEYFSSVDWMWILMLVRLCCVLHCTNNSFQSTITEGQFCEFKVVICEKIEFASFCASRS